MFNTYYGCLVLISPNTTGVLPGFKALPLLMTYLWG